MSGFEPFLAATAAASSGIGLVKSVVEGNANARQAAALAAHTQATADYQRRLAATEEAALRRRQSRELARMRSLLAGRGVDVASGSALLAREQGEADAEFEALLQRASGAARTFDLDFQARTAAAKAAQARRTALYDTGTSLLTASRQTARYIRAERQS